MYICSVVMSIQWTWKYGKKNVLALLSLSRKMHYYAGLITWGTVQWDFSLIYFWFTDNYLWYCEGSLCVLWHKKKIAVGTLNALFVLPYALDYVGIMGELIDYYTDWGNISLIIKSILWIMIVGHPTVFRHFIKGWLCPRSSKVFFRPMWQGVILIAKSDFFFSWDRVPIDFLLFFAPGGGCIGFS